MKNYLLSDNAGTTDILVGKQIFNNQPTINNKQINREIKEHQNLF